MSTQVWQPFWDRWGVVILDGGLASELQRRGADLHDPLWSARLLLEGPERIRQVHEDYFQAGADVGISASYQASLEGLQARGLSRAEASRAIQSSVALVRQARDRFWQDAPAGRIRPLVAASIGPYGAYLHDGSEYRGAYGVSVRALMDWHRPRLELLLEAEPDLLACESIPCLEEAEALLRLLEEYAAPASWLTFTCRDRRSISQGEPFAEAVRMVSSSQHVSAVGINCTPPGWIRELLGSVAGCAKPIFVYPNRGERWNASAGCWEENSAALDWSRWAREWHTAGARGIGGCCRTTPETIRELRAAFAR